MTERTRLRRIPEQGSYDRADIDAVLDAGFVCHLGLVVDGWPMVVPTTYARVGDRWFSTARWPAGACGPPPPRFRPV